MKGTGAEQLPPSTATSAAQSHCSALSVKRKTLQEAWRALQHHLSWGPWAQDPSTPQHQPPVPNRHHSRSAVCAALQGLQTHGWIYPNNCIMISAFTAQTSYKEWNKNTVIKRQYYYQNYPCLAVGFFSPTASHQGPYWVRAVSCGFPSS